MKGRKAVSWLLCALQRGAGLPGSAEGAQPVPDRPPLPCLQCLDSLCFKLQYQAICEVRGFAVRGGVQLCDKVSQPQLYLIDEHISNLLLPVMTVPFLATPLIQHVFISLFERR